MHNAECLMHKISSVAIGIHPASCVSDNGMQDADQFFALLNESLKFHTIYRAISIQHSPLKDA